MAIVGFLQYTFCWNRHDTIFVARYKLATKRPQSSHPTLVRKLQCLRYVTNGTCELFSWSRWSGELITSSKTRNVLSLTCVESWFKRYLSWRRSHAKTCRSWTSLVLTIHDLNLLSNKQPHRQKKKEKKRVMRMCAYAGTDVVFRAPEILTEFYY